MVNGSAALQADRTRRGHPRTRAWAGVALLVLVQLAGSATLAETTDPPSQAEGCGPYTEQCCDAENVGAGCGAIIHQSDSNAPSTFQDDERHGMIGA